MEDVSAFKPALHYGAASTLAAAAPLPACPTDGSAVNAADGSSLGAASGCYFQRGGGARLGRAWRGAARRLQAGVDRLCTGQLRAAQIAKAQQEEVNRRLERVKVVCLSLLPESLKPFTFTAMSV